MTSGRDSFDDLSATWPWFSVSERRRRLRKMVGKTGNWLWKYGKFQRSPVVQATEKEDHEWRHQMFNSKCEHIAAGLAHDLWAPSIVSIFSEGDRPDNV